MQRNILIEMDCFKNLTCVTAITESFLEWKVQEAEEDKIIPMHRYQE